MLRTKSRDRSFSFTESEITVSNQELSHESNKTLSSPERRKRILFQILENRMNKKKLENKDSYLLKIKKQRSNSSPPSPDRKFPVSADRQKSIEM